MESFCILAPIEAHLRPTGVNLGRRAPVYIYIPFWTDLIKARVKKNNQLNTGSCSYGQKFIQFLTVSLYIPVINQVLDVLI